MQRLPKIPQMCKALLRHTPSTANVLLTLHRYGTSEMDGAIRVKIFPTSCYDGLIFSLILKLIIIVVPQCNIFRLQMSRSGPDASLIPCIERHAEHDIFVYPHYNGHSSFRVDRSFYAKGQVWIVLVSIWVVVGLMQGDGDDITKSVVMFSVAREFADLIVNAAASSAVGGHLASGASRIGGHLGGSWDYRWVPHLWVLQHGFGSGRNLHCLWSSRSLEVQLAHSRWRCWCVAVRCRYTGTLGSSSSPLGLCRRVRQCSLEQV
jgi:hypothetical protein